MHLLAFLLCLAACPAHLRADTLLPNEVEVLSDLIYKNGKALSDYETNRCKLDLYLPKIRESFATLIWFHGGGLEKGDKAGAPEDSVLTPLIARSLAEAGIAVVAPNYRLSPKATFPAYLEDAASAVAWTKHHIAEHGGNPATIYIGGHSAGGYIALMLGVDERYLSSEGISFADIKGLIPVSGQTMTHYTVRGERGLGKFQVTADDAAPIHFCGPHTPPFLVLYADRDIAARAEENMLFVEMMKAAGNKTITSELIKDRTHGSIASEIANSGDPARNAILKFMGVIKP